VSCRILPLCPPRNSRPHSQHYAQAYRFFPSRLRVVAAAMIFLILGPETTFAWARTASLPAIFMALTTLAPDSSLFFEAWLTTTLAPAFSEFESYSGSYASTLLISLLLPKFQCISTWMIRLLWPSSHTDFLAAKDGEFLNDHCLSHSRLCVCCLRHFKV
jgi:hypothetical protein